MFYSLITRFLITVLSFVILVAMENKMIPINLIVAVTNNTGIGKNGTMPWPRLPNESKYFQMITTRCSDPGKQNAVIIGRKTWESIPVERRPLKNRLNVIISRTLKQNDLPDKARVFSSFDEAMKFLSSPPVSSTIETIWDIGGRDMYQLGLSHSAFHRLYLTRISADYDCDVFFPDVNWTQLQRTNDPDVPSEKQTEKGVDYHFEVYERIS